MQVLLQQVSWSLRHGLSRTSWDCEYRRSTDLTLSSRTTYAMMPPGISAIIPPAPDQWFLDWRGNKNHRDSPLWTLRKSSVSTSMPIATFCGKGYQQLCGKA